MRLRVLSQRLQDYVAALPVGEDAEVLIEGVDYRGGESKKSFSTEVTTTCAWFNHSARDYQVSIRNIFDDVIEAVAPSKPVEWEQVACQS